MTPEEKMNEILDWVQDTLNVNWGFMCCLRDDLEDLVAIAQAEHAVIRCEDCQNRQNPEECPMCFTEVVDVTGGRMYKFTDLTHDAGYCHRGVKKIAAD